MSGRVGLKSLNAYCQLPDTESLLLWKRHMRACPQCLAAMHEPTHRLCALPLRECCTAFVTVSCPIHTEGTVCADVCGLQLVRQQLDEDPLHQANKQGVERVQRSTMQHGAYTLFGFCACIIAEALLSLA
eukprot:scaffold247255_cov23-Tisochrysis_lutea.AAC.1